MGRITACRSSAGRVPAGLRRRGAAHARGQSTVEFALIALPFFAIFFAIIDYAQIYFYENALQNALRETSRFATAGRVIQAHDANGPLYDTNSGVVTPQAIRDTEGREASRYGCIRMWFQSNCVVQMPTNNILVVSATALPGAPPVLGTNTTTGYVQLQQDETTLATNGPGGATDYIQITATYTLHTITPIFGYLNGYSRNGFNVFPVRVSAIVKNEPALLNFQKTNMYPDETP